MISASYLSSRRSSFSRPRVCFACRSRWTSNTQVVKYTLCPCCTSSWPSAANKCVFPTPWAAKHQHVLRPPQKLAIQQGHFDPKEPGAAKAGTRLRGASPHPSSVPPRENPRRQAQDASAKTMAEPRSGGRKSITARFLFSFLRKFGYFCCHFDLNPILKEPGCFEGRHYFRGASPTLLTPPGKFKGELCGHLKTVTLGPALGKLFFFFLSKIVHLLVEIVRERSKPLRRYLFGGTKISKDE